jgi:hypothetical protein
MSTTNGERASRNRNPAAATAPPRAAQLPRRPPEHDEEQGDGEPQRQEGGNPTQHPKPRGDQDRAPGILEGPRADQDLAGVDERAQVDRAPELPGPDVLARGPAGQEPRAGVERLLVVGRLRHRERPVFAVEEVFHADAGVLEVASRGPHLGEVGVLLEEHDVGEEEDGQDDAEGGHEKMALVTNAGERTIWGPRPP